MSHTQQPQMKVDYNQYKVVELKAMIKERNVLAWDCKRKADYVKALEDHDKYEQSHTNFMNGIKQLGENMKKQKEEIADGLQKIRDTCKTADAAIKILEEKEDKTIEDYEKLVKLLKTRMKLMKDY
jgi:hypothetical protein